MKTKILTLPGYLGSDTDHWQTIWEQELDNIEQVEQRDWEFPQLPQWLETLDSHIQNTDERIVLVSHSLGCSLIAHWASNHQSDNVIDAKKEKSLHENVSLFRGRGESRNETRSAHR